MNVGRLVRTVRELRPTQVAHRALHAGRWRAYRVLGRHLARNVVPDVSARSALSAADLVPLALPASEPELAERWLAGFVEYLGIGGPRFDWRGAGRTRLWRYEHQYHTELPALAVMARRDWGRRDVWLTEARELLRSWMSSCPPYSVDAWEPYPVARRLLNWAMAIAVAPELAPEAVPMLAAQAQFLEGHLELHLLGNHYLCDLAGLVAARAVLEGAEHDRGWTRAAERLARELRAQVLPDGGYQERTVQYHAIVVRDVLWAAWLSRLRGRDLGLNEVLARMLRWLVAVERTDGGFPWLNDAAPDATPSLDDLVRLAEAIGVSTERAPNATNVRLDDTGWSLLREGAHELLLEHGPIGPREQPGHGHDDLFSFELTWNGRAVVRDTGVSTYERGSDRDYERSARAHSTVTVNGQGHDEVWASFRVGGRSTVRRIDHVAGPLGAWHRVEMKAVAWNGWHHRRCALFWPGRCLLIHDEIDGHPPDADVSSRVTLAPGWDLHREGERVSLVGAGDPLCFGASGAAAVEVEAGWCAAGFGRRVSRSVLKIPFRGRSCTHWIASPDVKVRLTAARCEISTADQSIALEL